jgi:hypothetical protein
VEVGGARREAEETMETNQEWRWKLMRIILHIYFWAPLGLLGLMHVAI